ncbi:hypothetical protein EON62_05885 [archaeon]|nr:MAG: hypothetical protein EON62_05885 [archaeon]
MSWLLRPGSAAMPMGMHAPEPLAPPVTRGRDAFGLDRVAARPLPDAYGVTMVTAHAAGATAQVPLTRGAGSGAAAPISSPSQLAAIGPLRAMAMRAEALHRAAVQPAATVSHSAEHHLQEPSLLHGSDVAVERHSTFGGAWLDEQAAARDFEDALLGLDA